MLKFSNVLDQDFMGNLSGPGKPARKANSGGVLSVGKPVISVGYFGGCHGTT